MATEMQHRNRWIGALLLFVSLASPAPGQGDDLFREDLAAAEASLLRGKHSKARNQFEEIVDAYAEESGDDRPSAAVLLGARLGLLRLDLIVGEYGRVLAGYAALDEAGRQTQAAVFLAVEAWRRTGEYERAEKALRTLIAAGKGGIEARYRLGLALGSSGPVQPARAEFQATIASSPTQLDDPVESCYLARCHMELGGRAHLETASGLLVASIRKAPERPEARIAYAELLFLAYRESSGYPTAEKQLKPVFENNGEVEEALLVMYRSRSFNMFLEGGKTGQYLSRALALNPNSVPALVLSAMRQIDDRLFESGEQILDRALKINPRHREALSHRAAVAYLRHDETGLRNFRERATAGRKTYPELDRILGDHLAALYRFKDSVPFFRAALKQDPDYVPAMHGLAKSLVYLGQGDEAVKLLERAKQLEAGFADSWRKNILLSEKRLAKEYELVRSDHFLVIMHREDRAVLEPYLMAWFEDAYEKLGRKYGYKPTNQVRVEVLHEWVDFSVRTIGFRGFSALGACFGEFVTMVSPSDAQLRLNDFMWSATAWHEYTHVLTLALSSSRVPRWLTEGMSVYEESAMNPAWERGMERELLDAHFNGELPPLRLLNRVFRGSQILFGYYQGGLVVEYLAQHHGFGKVVSMLKGYGADKSTETIMQETFGIDSREFDRRFREWVETEKLQGIKLVPRLSPRTLGRLRSEVQLQPAKLESQLQLAWHFVRLADRRGRRVGLVEAGIHLGEVLRRQPDHPMGNLCHGELLLNRGQADAARKAFERGFRAGADDFISRLNFAGLLEKAEDLDGALAQYQAAKACWPKCTDQELAPQLRVAKILRQQGKTTEAMMEVKSFCKSTARAFSPRMELADYEIRLGNHQAAVGYLEECIQIDPFMRSLHEKLAEAFVKIGKLPLALREYKVALAVAPELDRAYIRAEPGSRPASGSAEERLARGQICVKIARICWAMKDREQAIEYLDRAAKEASDTPLADDIHELRATWLK